MKHSASWSFGYDLVLCSLALGCLFASPLTLAAKVGIAAGFLAVVNGIMEVGLSFGNVELARRLRAALRIGTSHRAETTSTDTKSAGATDAAESLSSHVTADLFGMLIHNVMAIAGGAVIAVVLNFAGG